MAFTTLLDLTEKINSDPNNEVVIDTNAYASIVIQPIGIGGSVTISTTNDGGGVLGVLEPSSISADNFIECYGQNLNSSTLALIKTIPTTICAKFSNYGKYLKLTASGNLDKLFLNCYQIN